METVTLAIIGGVLLLAVAAFLLTRGGSKAGAAAEDTGLHAQEYRSFKLISRSEVSRNAVSTTVLFRFSLAHPGQRVGLPVGKHMSLKATDAEGKVFMRSYTPVSSDDDLGYFDLLVKLYANGKMSQVLANLQLGETIQARGPQGSLAYAGKGQFHIKRNNNPTVAIREIGMIAGGSGITPMLQVMRAVHKAGTSDTTKLALLFANASEADILLRSELETLHESRGDTKVVLSVDRHEGTWPGPVGFVTKDVITAHLPAPGPNTLVLLCGPPPMVAAMVNHLTDLKYTEEMIFKF